MMQEHIGQSLPTGWEAVRNLFPAVKSYTYLNTASRGAVSSWVIQAVQNYYEELSTRSELTLEDWLGRADPVRRKLANLINADSDTVAFLSNSSQGMNFGAQLFAGMGDVLTFKDEFPSVTLPWLQHDYPVQLVKSQSDGTIKFQDIEGAIAQNTKLLVTSHVQYSTGFRHDLAALGKLCRDRGLIFVVDATQAFGAFPIDVEKYNIDLLVFSGYKWATAGYGIAGLYVRKEILESYKLPAVGWRSAKHPHQMINHELNLAKIATALELGHPPFPGIFALDAALNLLEQLGIENIERRILELTDYLHTQLHTHGIDIRSPGVPQHRSGITVLAVNHPQSVAEALKNRHILVAVREKGLRVSLHFYNNRSDVERLLSELLVTSY